MAATARKRAISQNLVADCPASAAVKDVVYISADEVAGVFQVSLVNIDSTTTYPILGVIIRKLTTTRCVVQVGGEIEGLYTGLDPGKQLFVNSSARLSHSVPTHPGSGVRLVYPAALALADNVLLLRAGTPTIIRA